MCFLAQESQLRDSHCPAPCRHVPQADPYGLSQDVAWLAPADDGAPLRQQWEQGPLHGLGQDQQSEAIQGQGWGGSWAGTSSWQDP